MREGDTVEFHVIDNCQRIRRKQGVVIKKTFISVSDKEQYSLEELDEYLSDTVLDFKPKVIKED